MQFVDFVWSASNKIYTDVDIAKSLDTDFVLLMDASDLLLPDCLLALAGPLQSRPEIDLVYADEDRLGVEDEPERPLLKPGWSPELLTSLPYLGRPWLLRRQLRGARSQRSQQRQAGTVAQ